MKQIQIGAIAIAVLLFGLIAAYTLNSQNAPEVAQERLELDPMMGNPDAPITITEYAAYGCEACRQWHGTAFPLF